MSDRIILATLQKGMPTFGRNGDLEPIGPRRSLRRGASCPRSIVARQGTGRSGIRRARIVVRVVISFERFGPNRFQEMSVGRDGIDSARNCRPDGVFSNDVRLPEATPRQRVGVAIAPEVKAVAEASSDMPIVRVAFDPAENEGGTAGPHGLPVRDQPTKLVPDVSVG